jgi:hypothetical protein
MPGSVILLGPTELAESTAVSIKPATKARCSFVQAYKIPQNCGVILHSLGAFFAVDCVCNPEKVNPHERETSISAVEAENAIETASRSQFGLKFLVNVNGIHPPKEEPIRRARL